MQKQTITEYDNVRVLTSEQLAEAYGTDRKTISYNFSYNKKKYTEGKHYIKLEGAELKAFKGSREIPDWLKFSTHLYLWTEKGALLHAKSLNTDKAWEVYDYLVDFYFRAKEEVPETPAAKPVPVDAEKPKQLSMRTVVDIPDNPKILNAIGKVRDDLTAMDVLLDDCIRYSSEETYKERRKAAAEVVHIIIGDLSVLLDLKPKLVSKQF